MPKEFPILITVTPCKGKNCKNKKRKNWTNEKCIHCKKKFTALERESEGESSYPMCSTSELSYIHKPLTCMKAHPEINVSKRTDFRTDFQIPERDCCNKKEPLEFSQDKSFLTDFSPSYWPYSSLNQFCHDLCSLHLHTVQKVLTKDSSTCTGSCYTSNMECQCYIKPRKTFLSKLCSFLTK